MTTVTLHEGDNREHLRRLIDQGVRVHSVITDPPYGLTSVTKRFGKEGSAPARFGTDGAFARASGGFMGKAWDASGIERDPEFWRLIWEILLPGGFVAAFSGSRTGHWQACAMEMAGFIMHPMHGWLYGSGMPKAHNPCPAIDKHMGVEGTKELDGRVIKRIKPGADQNKTGHGTLDDRTFEFGRYVPSSPEAPEMGWLAARHQSQKPALEPVYLGQKSYSEKTGALNLLKHGVGAVNIDGCRVPSPGETITNHSRGAESAISKGIFGDSSAQETHQTAGQALGRYPSNLMHDGSPEVLAMFPDSAGQQGDLKNHNKMRQSPNGTFGPMGPAADHPARNDSGSAGRFFHQFPITEDDYQWAIDAGVIDDVSHLDPVKYHPKANTADRAGSRHPTVKAIDLVRHWVRHLTPPGVVLDPFAGSGTTAEAARREGFDCILMEQDPDYATFLRQRFTLPLQIIHQTAKPAPTNAVFPPEIRALLASPEGAEKGIDVVSLLG